MATRRTSPARNNSGNIPKTNRELAIALGYNPSTTDFIEGARIESSIEVYTGILKEIKEIYKTEEDRVKVIKNLQKLLQANNALESDAGKLVDKALKEAEALLKVKEQQVKQTKAIKDGWKQIASTINKEAGKALDKVIQQSEQLFKLSHEIQLESNITWKQYQSLYSDAYEAARKLNSEVGQAVTNAKEQLETTNRLMQAGFRGINTGDIASMSAAAYTLQKTLGVFPEELAIAFQQSYRQFGDQTDTFITAIGNRLNAFSDNLGLSVAMMTGAIAQLSEENSFLFRNNMNAQVAASESLIKATALAGMMGLSSANFLTSLAETSQFGSMEEMASIYQGGALLQGFSTDQFQSMMQSGDYQGGTEMLFSSIANTLGGIQDQYLRAEYMKQIESSFGLSRDEQLLITQNADNLSEYIATLDEESLNVNKSMEEELTDLNESLMEKLDNWWSSTGAAEEYGKIMQNAGLVGIEGYLKNIVGVLYAMLLKEKISSATDALTGGKGIISGLGSFLSSATPAGTGAFATVGPALGLGALGIGGMVASNVAGRNIQTNTNLSDAQANIGGGAVNIGGSVASGALAGGAIGSFIPVIGTAVGAVVGAIGGLVVGGINTYLGAQERKTELQKVEDENRAAAKARKESRQTASTGDPLIDAINAQTDAIVNTLNGNTEETISASFVLGTYNTTVVDL